MENKYGSSSELSLEISCRDKKTIVSDAYFTPPLKIMKPFYENGRMRLLQMSASPGMMAGDRQDIRIRVGEHTVSELYSQSFEKIHKMEQGRAERNIYIELAQNSFFVYSPLPVIPYAGSAMENKITVTLCDDSPVFIYSDILSCGRAARGEKFAYRYYHSLVTIYEDGNLAFRDNTRYQPKHMDMDGIGLYEGETHLLSMVICNLDLDDEIAGFFKNYGKPYGITKNDKGYVIIKALGNSAQKLQEIADKIKEFCYGIYKNS